MIHISVIVSQHSHILENTLLSIQETFPTRAEASAFREELDIWIEGRPPFGLPVVQQETDLLTQQAAQLFNILDGRDPAVFGKYYEDSEYRAALLERRPYDVQRLAS